MTTFEACALLVATIRQLAIERACGLELERQRDSYRELAQVAIEEVAHLTQRLKRQNATIANLHEMLRDQRRREEPAA